MLNFYYGSLPTLRELTVSTAGTGANGSASISCAENHGYPSGGFLAGSSGSNYYDGTNVTLVAPSANTGYHFQKWTKGSSSTSLSTNTSYEFSVSSTNNGAYKANFTANTYNVVFNKNGGSGMMSNQSHTYGSSKALTANAFTAPAGKRFKGWATSQANANAGTVAYEDKQSVTNLTTTNDGTFNLYAVWEDDVFTLTLDVTGNGTVTAYSGNNSEFVTFTNNKAEIEYEDEIVITYAAAPDYRVGSFYDSEDGAMPSGYDFFVEGSRTITVTFAQNDYFLNATYGAGGASVARSDDGNSTTVKRAGNTVTLTPSAANGYEFLAWGGTDAAKVSNNIFTFPTNGTHNTTYNVQATFQAITYDISYEGLEGATNTNNPTSYTIETSTITLADPGTRTGYTFNNWTCGGNAITQIAVGSTGNKTITANWTPNTNTAYTVKHYQQNLTLDGYTEVEGDRQNLTGTTAASTAAEAKSYTGFTAQSFSQGTIAADGTTVVSIYYNRNLFTITWKNGTTTLETDENVPYGATPSYDGENPTKDADASYTYDFNTWSPAVATVTDDATYSATFTSTPVEYTITYHLNGGEGADNGSYTYESATITLPTAEDMTKANHTFAGWYNNAELEGDAVTVVAAGSTGNKEFWAKWTLNGYVITFKDYDGETTLQSTAVAQGTRPSIADPTRADDEENNIAYSFIGWKSSADDNVYTTANLPVATAEVTYTAQYEPYFLIRDDKENNDAYYGALAAQAGKTLDVKYKRTFPKGRWSTLSLPFAYSFRTNINPFDGKLYYLISANYTAGGYLTLNCMPVTTGIEANKAYILILGEEDENIVNPTFKGAKMKRLEHKYYTAPNVDGIGNGVIFRNTIERETLEKDKRVIYLSGNRLYYPNLAPEASSWIYPFRGYFYLNIAEGQIQYSPARVRLVNEEGETIETLPEASEETSAEVKKYIENGILVIERAGIKYDAQGHIIK